MSEEKQVELMNEALKDFAIDDVVHTVGQMQPRGRSGASAGGAFLGSGVGGSVGGSLGDAVGLGAGMIAGGHMAAAGQNLPVSFQVGVSDTHIYGMHATARWRKPDRLLFAVPRSGISALMHQRGMVRVLELINDETGERIELEGSRVPITHSNDVIKVLTGHDDAS